MRRFMKDLLIMGAIGAGTIWTARQAVRRCRWFEFAGKSVIVTGGSRGLGLVCIGNVLSPVVWAARISPTLTGEILALVNRLLPEPGGIGQNAAFGYESQSTLSPSLLTTLGDKAAARNNELSARQV